MEPRDLTQAAAENKAEYYASSETGYFWSHEKMPSSAITINNHATYM